MYESRQQHVDAIMSDPQQPQISHTMILVLTYDSPITESTVKALVDVHQEDEGMLRVSGRLV